MADAKKCDRCGSFYDRMRDPCKGFVLSEYPSNSGLIKVVDLCPTCSHLLDLWMEGKAEIVAIDVDAYENWATKCMDRPREEDDIHEV